MTFEKQFIHAVSNSTNSIDDFETDSTILNFLWENKLFYYLNFFYGKNLKLNLFLDYNKRYINKMFLAANGVFEKLNKQGIQYVVIKGAVLSKLAYGEIHYRPSIDIDILISKQDLKKLEEILCQENLKQGYVDEKGHFNNFTRERHIYVNCCTHQILPYLKKIDNTIDGYLMLDINTTIFWKNDIKFDLKDFLNNRTNYMDICGIKIKCADHLGNFIITCLHHYKNLNSEFLLLQNGFCINLFFDIFYLLINNIKTISCNNLIDLAEQLGVRENIYFCLYYTNQIFRNDIIEKYVEQLYTTKGNILLDYYGIGKLKKKWHLSFVDRFQYEKLKMEIIQNLSEDEKRKMQTMNNMLKR